MNQTLRDAFARELDDAGRFQVDAQSLVERGETQLRRRRLTAVVGGTVAVVALVAVGVGVALANPHAQSPGPVQRPSSPSTTQTTPEEISPRRKVVYFDVAAADNPNGPKHTTVHYGNRVIDIGPDWIFMDVTDDGLVYHSGRDLMFTDGGTPAKITTDFGCGVSAGFPGTEVTAANEGSFVAWFDCSGPPPAQLVVFDTNLGTVVARHPVPQCGMKRGFYGCEPGAIIGDHVYFTGPYFLRSRSDVFEFDIPTDHLSRIGTRDYQNAVPYLEDIRNHPRGFVVGDSWESGTPIAGLAAQTGLNLRVVGSRLVPQSATAEGAPFLTSAFDTATRRNVQLRVPAGYHGASGFTVFEWLDDDTVALIGPTGWDHAPGYGDILTCRLSDGHCDLTARGHGPVRVEANGGLPG